MSAVLLEVRDMCKNFGPTVALDHFSFSVRAGEIHGLIGENGSGKSTASSIVAGMQKDNGGEMLFKGEVWKPANAQVASRHGIGMVAQEAATLPNLTVAQNIFLGAEKKFCKGGLFVDRAAMNREAQKALDILGITDFHPSTPVRLLDMQARKLVEIARALYGQPELFIVDETSTVLSQTGRELLYKQMHRLAEEGKAVLIISHDLDELVTHCDSLTVLRDGKKIADIERSEFELDYIKRCMIGRDLSGNYYRNDMDGYEDTVVLRADRITNLNQFMNLCLELHKGEILGIGGLSQCGMHELGKALFGKEELLTGSVTLVDSGVTVKSPTIATKNKMAYLSKDRDTESLAQGSPIFNNVASTGYSINRWLGGLMHFGKEKRYVNQQVSALAIKCRNPYQEVRALSGGNKQKVVFGKWIAAEAEIYIMDCPTRGVDIGVKEAMYNLIYELKKKGCSIVMISEEMPELIGMSDRILILKDGRITGEFLRTDGFTEAALIEAMI